MNALLTAASLRDRDIEINWTDGRPGAVLPLRWLRDHCQCAACQHADTHQRQFDTFGPSGDDTARAIVVEDNGRALRIDWARDRHVSRFNGDFLATLRANPDVLPTVRLTWDRDSIANAVPQVPCDDFLRDDATLKELLEQVARVGFCFVEGVPGTPEATRTVATRIAYIRETIFGGYWDFTANMEHKDTAYTSLAIGPHTDGTYAIDAPGYQMFHCLAADCTGGENILLDGFKIAELLKRDHPADYRVLTEVSVPGHYLDHDRGIHLMARRPLLRLDESGELIQVSYNNHDRAPFTLPAPRHHQFYQALARFNALCAEPALQYRRRLLPGSMLIFDNWRILHARDAYVGYRRLAGVYLNKEDVDSRLRALRVKAGEAI